MIESRYWKSDLLKYARQFRRVTKPARYTEKLQVNFEKDIIIAFFMIRKLLETNKFSSDVKEYKSTIFKCPSIRTINSLNYWDIFDCYDIEHESKTQKDVKFICNQLVHGGATFAYRDQDRNWGGIYTCSDFERSKFIYRIPMVEIVHIIELAGNDYPRKISTEWYDKAQDYIIKSL